MNIKHLDAELKEDGIIFLAYDGFLTQALIVAMTEALEKEPDLSMTISTNILTIFIELSQNMMNYSKSQKSLAPKNDGKGMILVGHDENDQYYVASRNLVSAQDKEVMEKKLDKVTQMDKKELRVYYREMRKTGHEKHDKGAGIGFIEIARKCEKMLYSFEKVDGMYIFFFKAVLNKENNAKHEN